MNYAIILPSVMSGFLIGVVVGPIALLCMRRTIKEGFWVGVAAGLGVAIGDGIYSGIALCGVAALATILNTYWNVIELALGVYITYLGFDIIIGDQQEAPVYQSGGLFRATISTLLITLANPMTIFAFFTIFSTANIIALTMFDVAIGSISVSIGSLAWWTLLAACGHKLRTTVTRHFLQKLNILSGSGLAIFGIGAILNALWKTLISF